MLVKFNIMAQVKICSLNARGLRDFNKRKELYKWLNRQYDIICLQEVHSVVADEWLWRNQWGGSITIFAHGTSNSKGVCTLISKRASNIQIVSNVADPDGRYVIVELKINDRQFLIANIWSKRR